MLPSITPEGKFHIAPEAKARGLERAEARVRRALDRTVGRRQRSRLEEKIERLATLRSRLQRETVV